MGDLSIAHSFNLIASQLEAAASLLKYAGDDLRELLSRTEVPLAAEVAVLANTLDVQASSIVGSAAFCVRLGEGDEEDEDESSNAGMRITA